MQSKPILNGAERKARDFPTRTAETILYMLITNAIVNVAVTGVRLYFQEVDLRRGGFTLVFVALYLGFLGLARRGYTKMSVLIAIIINYSLAMLQVWLDGGITSPYFLPLLLSMITILMAYGSWIGGIASFFSLAAGVAFTYLQSNPNTYSLRSNILFQLTTFVLLGIYFIYAFRLYSRELQKNTRLAQDLTFSEARLKNLILNLPLGGLVVKLNGEISLVNNQLTRLTGYTPEDLRIIDDWYRLSLRDPERAAETRREMDEQFRNSTGSILIGDMPVQTRWGEWITCEGYANILGDEVIVLINDVTARKNAEKEIAHKFAQLSSLRTLDIAIVNSERLNELLDIFLTQIAGQLEADAIWIMLYDREQGDLFDVFTYGGTQADAPNRVESNEEMERILSASEPTLFENTESISAAFGANKTTFSFCAAIPMITKNGVIGILSAFRRSNFTPDRDWLRFFEALAGQTAIGVERINLTDSLRSLNRSLITAYDTTLQGWARALELRDKETEGHSRRVAEMTLELARAVGVPEEELQDIYRGALLHDIGKMPIPDRILLKNGPLTDEEWEIMRQHPETARQLLNHIPFLQHALEIPYGHHEHWDGSGYPQHLSGEEIPLPARLFAFADVWDALRSDRPYRPAWPVEKVIAYISERSGKQFDPTIAPVFEKIVQSQQS